MQQIFTCQTITSRLHVSARTWELRLNLNTLRSCGKHRAVEKCVVLRIKALNWVLVLCCAVLGQVNLYGQAPVVKLANARSFVNKLRRQIKRLINKRGGAWWRGWKFPLVFLFFSVFLYFFAHECFYVMKNTPKKVRNKTSSDNLDRRVLSQYNPPGNDRSSLDNILPAKISNFKREKRSLVVTLSLRDLKSFFLCERKSEPRWKQQEMFSLLPMPKMFLFNRSTDYGTVPNPERT